MFLLGDSGADAAVKSDCGLYRTAGRFMSGDHSDQLQMNLLC